jgi:Mn-dependent DtxR family transcriptional regulator
MITLIDIHIRDERCLRYIERRCASSRAGRAVIKYAELSSVLKCHENTARAILMRLERAGYIRVDRRCRKTGYVYEVTDAGRNYTG